MARLNTEPPVSTDSLETLRRKLLRQNRDLAKSNNIRALRIRELENHCALMLSENLELRGRILDLEGQVEDNEARRIADHALAIKEKLEAQLTEWGTMLAGLGLEPPPKRHSPRARKSVVKQRMSFVSTRPSPSQRRLRDIARDIEDLGHIPENKSYPRKSMNPEQILALRSEADEIESPELGPPPLSQFIDRDPVKLDSPIRTPEPSPPRSKMQPPVVLTSLGAQTKKEQPPPSPEKRDVATPKPVEPAPIVPIARDRPVDTPLAQPIKTGLKRKLAAREATEGTTAQQQNENKPIRSQPEKGSVLGKAEGKTLKELASIRKEARDKAVATAQVRKPLSSKSTNNDVNSPRKVTNTIKDEVAAAKADLKAETESKGKQKHDKSVSKPRAKPATKPKLVVDLPQVRDQFKPVVAELSLPVGESVLLAPPSPDTVPSSEEARGDTPPPAHISEDGETSRPSRRNRTAVSYAEPNLRDKMRRPSKQLFDAVAGETYARRSSVQLLTKRESDVTEITTTSVSNMRDEAAAESHGPVSPLAAKSSTREMTTGSGPQRRARVSATTAKSFDFSDDSASEDQDASKTDSSSFDGDVYDFNSSPPQGQKSGSKKPSRRQSKASSRRHSEAVDADEDYMPKEKGSSRRRSMMV